MEDGISPSLIADSSLDGKEVVPKRPYTIARWTFLLGKDGKVLRKDTHVDAPNDSRKAVAFLRRLPQHGRERP